MKYKLLIIFLSFKWIFRINLNDKVIYKKRKYIVTNGTVSNSWKLRSFTGKNIGYVSRVECKKVWRCLNMINSFKNGYRFYMVNWYDIWKREGIKQWMKDSNIW